MLQTLIAKIKGGIAPATEKAPEVQQNQRPLSTAELNTWMKSPKVQSFVNNNYRQFGRGGKSALLRTLRSKFDEKTTLQEARTILSRLARDGSRDDALNKKVKELKAKPDLSKDLRARRRKAAPRKKVARK